MDEILEIYERISDEVSLEDFEERVNEKIELMGGLCDRKTAAMLVAHEMGVDDSCKISEISLERENVAFIGKVVQAWGVREFTRDDGTVGRVANLKVADETGSVRLVLWDDLADLVKVGEIEVGDNLKIRGYVKEGMNGLEVNIGRGGRLEPTDEDVEVGDSKKQVEELALGQSDVDLTGVVLGIGSTRTFSRGEGEEGRVRGITLGDETGSVRVTLWDDRTEDAEHLREGDVVEVIGGYVRENRNELELHVGDRGALKRSDAEVKYAEKITDIGDIVPNEPCNVMGYVTGIGDVREFDRRDGSTGRVANIHVSDDTGRVRVALWGEHTDLLEDIDIGSEVHISDAYAKIGWQDQLELSVGNRSRVRLVHK